MPATTRYSKVIQLLEEGKPVFGTGLIWNGNLDEMTYFADSDYDMVMIEMEHEGLSFNNLRTSLQFLLNRKRVADGGGLQADPTPVVRIPPNTREQNQWVIKQALDTGVYGLILPHLDTVEVRCRRCVRRGTLRFRASPTLSRSANGAGGSALRPAIGGCRQPSITTPPTFGRLTPTATCC